MPIIFTKMVDGLPHQREGYFPFKTLGNNIEFLDGFVDIGK